MRIYLAGPMSKGNLLEHVRTAVKAASRLMDEGHSPFVPQVSILWELMRPQSYSRWLELDFEWIKVCEAVLRLPGESAGADKEVALAKELGIPVFTNVDVFLAWAGEGDVP